jgi:hypothetical protein
MRGFGIRAGPIDAGVPCQSIELVCAASVLLTFAGQAARLGPVARQATEPVIARNPGEQPSDIGVLKVLHTQHIEDDIGCELPQAVGGLF